MEVYWNLPYIFQIKPLLNFGEANFEWNLSKFNVITTKYIDNNLCICYVLQTQCKICKMYAYCIDANKFVCVNFSFYDAKNLQKMAALFCLSSKESWIGTKGSNSEMTFARKRQRMRSILFPDRFVSLHSSNYINKQCQMIIK